MAAPPRRPATASTSARKLSADDRHSLVAIGLGNLIEWFDWTIYATFAVYIAANYFDSDHPTSALLATLVVFAAGFVARPFGGIFFGWVADRRGRKFAMTLAIGMMSGASLVIAVSPTFGSIGVFASLLLVVSRLVQGVSQGGETPASYAFLSELAPAERRGLWSSLIYVSGTAGILLTVLLGVLLNTLLNDDQMTEFGWRIPFIIGAALGLFTLYMRRTMQESPVYAEAERAGNAGGPGILRSAIQYRRELATVVGLTVGFTTAYYAWVVNTPTYASTSLGYDRVSTLWSSAIASLCLIVSLPLWGMLSDYIGRRRVLMIAFGGALVSYLPATLLVRESVEMLTVALILMSVLLGGVAAIFPATLSEMLPTKVRATGIGFPYALAVAIFGGTAPYIQQATAGENGTSLWFPGYIMVALLTSTIVASRIPETRGKLLS